MIRDNETREPVRTLKTLKGRKPKALRTTLDRDDAGGRRERARAASTRRPRSSPCSRRPGDILAVANRPTDSTFDRALAGAYAPGSTFKVITTAALLRDGFDPRATSPARRRWSSTARRSRTSRARRRAPRRFADDFAISCNTAFVSLSNRLPASALGKVAKDYGVGRSYTLPVAGARSQVPAGHGQGEPRRGDDRPGPDHGHAAGHGRRRRHGRRRALAPAAAAQRRPAQAGTADRRQRTDHAARPDAPGRDPRDGRERRHPGRGRPARPARPSSARPTRPTPTPGSSPTAATSRSPCWSSRARAAGRSPRRSPPSSFRN